MPQCPNQLPLIPPADGQVRAAFIGEAPGREEVDAGQPFVGKAGRELDVWMKSFFIRSQCFMGNLSPDRPPDNKLSNWFLDSKNTIPNEKLQADINHLKEQLEQLRPHIIIALGRHPTYILTGRDYITKQTGSILPCTLVPGLKVMALYHPAHIIRPPFLYDLRPVIKVWMKRAKAQSHFPEYKPPVRELVVDPTLERVMYELDRLMGAKELAFDIETIPSTPIPYEVNGMIYTPDIMTCISFSDRPDWSISIPFSRAGGQHRWAVDVEMEIMRKVARLLAQKGPLKIAHNLMFDFLELAGRRIFVAPPYYDTMVAHQRSYTDLSKKKLKQMKMNSLAFCTSFYTEEPFYKDDHKDDNKSENWRGADRDFWIYNAKDSAVLHEIKAATKSDLIEAGTYDLFLRDMRVFKPLACMGIMGVRRDIDKVEKLYNELENEEGTGIIQLLQDELDKTIGYPLNTKSSPQMQKLLYRDLGLDYQINRKTGRPTTDEMALAKLYQKTKNPILKDIINVTRMRTFKQNSLSDIISLDGRTRTTYNQSKVSTYRISSSDAILGKGKNNQTVPSRSRPGEDTYNRLIRELKETYLPDPGNIMFKRDYSQAEARVVDYLSENLEAIADYANGIDKHCKTTAIIYDLDYQYVYDEYKSGNPEMKMKRNVGKPVRHGFNYKLGKIRLSGSLAKDGLDIPPKQCERFLQAIAAADPYTLRWQDEVEYQVKTNRLMTTPWGRRRYFLGIIDDETVREAIAWVPQSTVGDLMNFALDDIYHKSGIMDKGLDLLLQQHDAAIWQCPEKDLADYARIVAMWMTIPLTIKGRELIIPSDLEVGPSWGELK